MQWTGKTEEDLHMVPTPDHREMADGEKRSPIISVNRQKSRKTFHHGYTSYTPWERIKRVRIKNSINHIFHVMINIKTKAGFI